MSQPFSHLALLSAPQHTNNHSQSTVFDDLAHTIVHSTTLSLLRASTLIPTTPADSRLFLIKHLLLLKSQIVAFDIEYVHQPSPTLDFSNITSTFFELSSRGSIFDVRNLWRLMTLDPRGLIPKVVENMLDAKVELDGRLRTVINDFVTSHASLITKEIDSSATAKPRFDPIQAVTKVKETAEKEIPLLRRRLDSYLDDPRTKETLVAAVRDQVLLNYESFYDLWTERQAKEMKGDTGGTPGGKSKKGKGKEGEVWDADMFGEWIGGLFNVKGLGLGGADSMEEDSRSVSVSRHGSV